MAGFAGHPTNSRLPYTPPRIFGTGSFPSIFLFLAKLKSFKFDFLTSVVSFFCLVNHFSISPRHFLPCEGRECHLYCMNPRDDSSQNTLVHKCHRDDASGAWTSCFWGYKKVALWGRACTNCPWRHRSSRYQKRWCISNAPIVIISPRFVFRYRSRLISWA